MFLTISKLNLNYIEMSILEDYVDFKQAKLLKENGFPQEFINGYKVFCTVGEFKGKIVSYNDCAPEIDKKYIASPSLYVAQKWLRNTRNIHLVIHKDRIDEWSVYGHEIAPIEFTVFPLLTGFDSYEEALSTGITKALESLKL